MWKIDRDLKITMTRGDTPSFRINLTTTNEFGDEVPYIPVDGDRIIFALKKNANDDNLWAVIDIPTDTMILRFRQETTKILPFGNYVYEISLNNDNIDYHDTFIANVPLILTEELY